MRAGGLLACLLLTSLGPTPAWAGDVPAPAQRNFLHDRDALRLALALEASGLDAARPERVLAEMAAGRQPVPAHTDARGLAALPAVVAALKALDLPEAARAQRRADTPGGGIAAVWAGALVRMRRGDDAGAVGRLLAPPAFDWQRDAFMLALVGAALPAEDRMMLAAIGQAALGRAAARRRTGAITATALALAALDGDAGAAAFVRAMRALRRAGDVDGAEQLFFRAPAVGVERSTPLLAFEGALTAWARGDDAARARRLARASPPAGAQSVFLALRRAGRRPLRAATTPPLRHLTKGGLHAELIARLAHAAGVPTQRDDVLGWPGRGDRAVSHAGVAPAFLASRGLTAVSLAGRPEAGEALLAQGRSFLLYRLARNESDYRGAPVLVRASDPRTGLWLVDEPDLDRVDVVARSEATKSRLLVALPPGTSRAGLDAGAVRDGAVIQRALAQAADGAVAEAIEALRTSSAGGSAVVNLHLALLLHRRAVHTETDAWLVTAREVLDRTRRTPPLLGFEEYVRAQALIVDGARDDGLAALARTERLEGPSATVALLRYGALSGAGDLPGALAALTAARRLAPLDPRVLFYRGLAHASAGDIGRARADLRRALDRRPDAARVAVTLAALERDQGRPDVALRVLRESIRHAPALAGNPVIRAARREAELALIEAAGSLEELGAARRSGEPETRRRLAFALAAREGDDAEAMLRKLLADEATVVRISTLRLYMRPWLRRRIETDAVLGRTISDVLEKDPEGPVRAAAARLLARVQTPFSMRALSEALRGEARDEDGAVRAAAARALAAHPGAPAAAALVDALEDDDPGVRQAAIGALFERTATRRDFDPDAEAAERAAAVARWRAWLEASK